MINKYNDIFSKYIIIIMILMQWLMANAMTYCVFSVLMINTVMQCNAIYDTMCSIIILMQCNAIRPLMQCAIQCKYYTINE